MLISAEFDPFFKTVVRSLSAYLGEIVCIGGCANALYRHHPKASPTAVAYIGTQDIDWAVGQKLPVQGGKPISQIMEDSGFREEIHGTDIAPVIKYVPVDGHLAAEVEFLCPASGLRGSRNGRLQISHDVQAGLKVQPLRYLEILQANPWRVDLGRLPSFDDLHEVVVQIPNPAAYVAQKVLIRKQRRPPESMAKDCYYIFEISFLFRDALDSLAEEFQKLAGLVPKKWLHDFRTDAGRLFQSEHAEGPVSAMKVYRALPPPEAGKLRLDEKIIAAAVNQLLIRMTAG